MLLFTQFTTFFLTTRPRRGAKRSSPPTNSDTTYQIKVQKSSRSCQKYTHLKRHITVDLEEKKTVLPSRAEKEGCLHLDDLVKN